MIRLKTFTSSRMLKMGAIVAEASESDANLLYDYGLNLGLAFQLQDDYLDTFEIQDFGSRLVVILLKIKTYLYLKALELASKDDKQKLLFFYEQN